MDDDDDHYFPAGRMDESGQGMKRAIAIAVARLMEVKPNTTLTTGKLYKEILHRSLVCCLYEAMYVGMYT